MTNRHQQQGQGTGLPSERDPRQGGTPPVEPGTTRPPAPNREGPGPGLPMAIIIGIVVIFVLIFAVVLM